MGKALIMAAAVTSLSGHAFGQEAEIEPLEPEVWMESETPATAESDLEQQQWNRWACRARASWGWSWQTYWGYSYYFRAGSGEGQQARDYAQLSAIRECEFRTGRQCQSYWQSDCQVQRY